MSHTIESTSPALVFGVSYRLSVASEPAKQEEEQPGSALLGFMVVILLYLILGMGATAAWALWHSY
jgi:hypothetical protein